VSDKSDSATYRRQLIRLLWRCLIYNTEGCKKFDPEWYANALSISQKLNRHVPSASNGTPTLGEKMFDVDCDLPNYFNEVEKVVTFADTKFVVDEQFIEICLCMLPNKFLVTNNWWWALRCTKMAMSIFDGSLPKCKDYFLHKFSKKIPAGMKSVNYSREGNEAQWDNVKPCSVGIAIT